MTILYFPPINKLGNVSFRRSCITGGADFVFTEMIKADKLVLDDEVALRKLFIPENMKNNTIVQIIAEDITLIETAVDTVMKHNPDLFEINYNMGCPQSSLCKKECGAGIIGNIEKVKAVAIELKKACDKYGVEPSIKIRLGLTRDSITIYENVLKLREIGYKKIYIHGRCLSDTYNKPATYDEIANVKKMFPDMEIIANGDVRDHETLMKILETNCDGVLIGRAALENPHIFNEIRKKGEDYEDSFGKYGITFDQRKDMILEYLEFARNDNTTISQIKANITYMTRNVIGASEFRKIINDINDVEGIIGATKSYSPIYA